jgi:hypothetical protein
MRQKPELASVLAIAIFAVACGSSHSEVSTQAEGGAAGDASDAALADVSSEPSIDPTTDTSALTPAQAGALCDWMSQELGGYGTTTDCGGGQTVSNAPDQATCVATQLTFRCSVTVGQLETCVVAEVPNKGCILVQPQCTPLLC